ncbi:hypothetical protein SPB_1643 [Streptococcus parauberis NCFD 2020]|uniref:Uncharacterized protein n=1 Tax=Streptococcus parauberis NCFD 2020 TaxID=873447 RepID=F1YZ35_9STRE|nr:hypothetical protein SPB_1643 [Streptococcus parauberis NCFD 2020]
MKAIDNPFKSIYTNKVVRKRASSRKQKTKKFKKVIDKGVVT